VSPRVTTLEQEEALAGLERAMRSLDDAVESGQRADIRRAAARLAAYAWLAGRRSR
jgi:hypothetical protein